MQHLSGAKPLTWDMVAPQFDALLQEELRPAGVPDWIRRWSELEKQVWEARAWLKRAKSWNQSDREAHAAFQHFHADVFSPFEVAGQVLKTKLLAVGDWSTPPEQHEMLRMMRNEAGLFREANVAVQAEIGALNGE